MHTREAQAHTDEDFLLYAEGFGIDNLIKSASSYLPNRNSISKPAVALGASALGLFAKATPFYCHRYQDETTKNAYFKDTNGSNFQVSREGCDGSVAFDNSFSIEQLSKVTGANISFPPSAGASNYIELANYYYDRMQLNIGANEIRNETFINLVKGYLTELEAGALAYDKAQEESARKRGEAGGILTGEIIAGIVGAIVLAIVIGCTIHACKKRQPCSDKKNRANFKEVEAPETPGAKASSSAHEMDNMGENEKSNAESDSAPSIKV